MQFSPCATTAFLNKPSVAQGKILHFTDGKQRSLDSYGVGKNSVMMTSQIEVEIAMGLIQLTGVLLPIFVGTAGYYLVHKETVDKVIKSHEDTLDDATIEQFLFPLFLLLLMSYTLTLPVIYSVNTFLSLALTVYGVFLLISMVGIIVVIGASLLHFTQLAVRFMIYLSIAVFIVALVLVGALWNSLVTFTVIVVFSVFWMLWLFHKYSFKGRIPFFQSDPEPDPKPDSGPDSESTGGAEEVEYENEEAT